jgi:hypothetical protein
MLNVGISTNIQITVFNSYVINGLTRTETVCSTVHGLEIRFDRSCDCNLYDCLDSRLRFMPCDWHLPHPGATENRVPDCESIKIESKLETV